MVAAAFLFRATGWLYRVAGWLYKVAAASSITCSASGWLHHAESSHWCSLRWESMATVTYVEHKADVAGQSGPSG